MKKTLSFILSLIMVIGIITNVPVTTVLAAEMYDNYSGQYGTIIPYDIDTEAQVSHFDLDIYNRNMYFMRTSVGCENAFYSIELYTDAEYTELYKNVSYHYSTDVSSQSLSISFQMKDFAKSITYYGKCYSYIESGENKTCDIDSVQYFTVNIEENPIESIEYTPTEPFELIENYDGYLQSEFIDDEETGGEYEIEYFWYDVNIETPGSIVTINYKDGTSKNYTSNKTGDFTDEEGNIITIDYSIPQSYYNQWTVGNEYNVVVSHMGFSTTVPVSIVENPVESISFTSKKPIKLIENYDGCWETGSYYDETIDEDLEVEYFEYDVWDYVFNSENTITVNYKDGSSRELSWWYLYFSDSNDDSIWSYGEFIDDDGNKIKIKFEFPHGVNNQWTVGNDYEGTFSYMGLTGNITVSVIENPVESISFVPAKPVELIEGIDNDWEESEWIYDEETGEEKRVEYFEYDIRELVNQTGNVLSVNYKDGTSVDFVCDAQNDYYDNSGNYISLGYGSEQNYSNQWMAGNEYEFTVSYLGVKTSVPVIVKELPVESVEWIKMPEKTEYIQGEYIDLSGGVIRITGKDGSKQDVYIKNGIDAWVCGWYIDTMDRWFFPRVSECAKNIGEQTYQFSFVGKNLSFDYNVTENKYTNATIQVNNAKKLIITLSCNDGTSTDFEFIDAWWGAGDYNFSSGFILTDKGLFYCKVHMYDNGEAYVTVFLGYGEQRVVLESNKIDNLLWYEFNGIAHHLSRLVGAMYGSTVKYNGEITDDNIEDIARIAMCNMMYLKGDYKYYWRLCYGGTYSFDIQTVEDAIYETFGSSVNLSDYSICGEADEVVTFETNDIKYEVPVDYYYHNGLWTICSRTCYGKETKIVIDENNIIKSFTIGTCNVHKSSAWIIDTNATYEQSGTKHKECTECGEILETAVISQLKPATPNISKISRTYNGVLLKWDYDYGSDYYIIYRKTAKTSWQRIAKVAGYPDECTCETDCYCGELYSEASYVDTKAKTGTTYYYTVKAQNEAGYSGYNKTGLKIKYVAAPKLTKITNESSGVRVYWSKISGADGYYLYRRVAGTKSWTKIATIKKGSTTSYLDKKASAGKTYEYIIKAYDGSTPSAAAAKVIKIERLTVPKLVSTSSSKTGITVKWGKVTGADGYYVYRKTGSGGWTRIATVKGNTKVSFVDKSAKKGVTYTYTVKAYSGSYTSAYNKTGLKIKDKY